MSGITRALSIAAVMAVLVAGLAARASAAPILYTVEQLSEAQWRYSYHADDNLWSQFQGFAIDFEQEFYGPISGATGGAGWNLFQSDPSAPADPNECCPAPGLFDAQTLTNAPELTPFTVDFTWLGTGTPGSQTYRIYYDDLQGGFQPLESGMTVAFTPAPVPEPGTLLLLASGLVAAALSRRRKRSSPSS